MNTIKDRNGKVFGKVLEWPNLSGANLSWADLSGADLTRANLFGTNLSGADLSWADLSEARYNGYTAWPKGFDPVAAGCVKS